MKISSRLAITFSVISSFVLIALGITIYLFTSIHRKHEFEERLESRVNITENFFLEKESYTAKEFEQIKSQFLHTLPNETEIVLEAFKDKQLVFNHHYSKEQINNFLQNDKYSFNIDDVQGVSKKFRINNKDYIIIVTAYDEIGLKNLVFLKSVIIFLILLGVPITFLSSFRITKKALAPIARKINRANNISASNLHQRLNVHNPDDEIGELAIAFNKMLDRLEASFEAQKSFISNASHEIKTPLTVIIGEADIAISRSRSKEEYVESLKSILSDAESLNATTNNLLQLSKISASQNNLYFETCNARKYFTEIFTSFELNNQQAKLQVNFNKRITDLPLFIMVNKNLMKTAIFNILDNAVKFSSNKEIRVSVTRNSGNQMKINISDKGLGIQPDEIKKITEPFYRAENAIGKRGSGIGLSIVEKIIELHQGDLLIESIINEGTTVTISLPCIDK